MKETKRQDLPSGLWVIATPIGNLADMAPRALQALEKADLILCEDTRRTAALLSALEIPHFTRRLDRLDAHTESQRLPGWIEALEEGKSLALVTDAGTPGVSDPGAILVEAARKAGVRITPFPGASAVSVLLSVAGFSETSFAFRGFFPRKIKEQEQELELALASKLVRVIIWFESPHRILDTLKVISQQNPEADLVVGKELTKIHEHLFYGVATDAYSRCSVKSLQREKWGSGVLPFAFRNLTQNL